MKAALNDDELPFAHTPKLSPLLLNRVSTGSVPMRQQQPSVDQFADLIEAGAASDSRLSSTLFRFWRKRTGRTCSRTTIKKSCTSP